MFVGVDKLRLNYRKQLIAHLKPLSYKSVQAPFPSLIFQIKKINLRNALIQILILEVLFNAAQPGVYRVQGSKQVQKIKVL